VLLRNLKGSSHIALDNPRAAEAVSNRIEHLTSLLSQRPAMGRQTDEPGVRFLSVVRYPYVVFYRVLPKKDEVQILRIRHTARRPLKGMT
jgi:toxin ParE1/3/4